VRADQVTIQVRGGDQSVCLSAGFGAIEKARNLQRRIEKNIGISTVLGPRNREGAAVLDAESEPRVPARPGICSRVALLLPVSGRASATLVEHQFGVLPLELNRAAV
jgi:hypothetical protein